MQGMVTPSSCRLDPSTIGYWRASGELVESYRGLVTLKHKCNFLGKAPDRQHDLKTVQVLLA